ncbi:hypothetical protein [Halothermothrix orenii]|uniref:Uncharacterized protein n=1 Tax=Halothermothrix orenii (strain H 168 / OCM 544 / DSM 9562) TaxID=373903 RepID=B8CX74_HALOH|nr:hypothetical protein [Halothermothrix orenii]ACL69893.1 hypothetical protein Hore_11410 [Halothermothrix orenii H 168]
MTEEKKKEVSEPRNRFFVSNKDNSMYIETKSMEIQINSDFNQNINPLELINKLYSIKNKDLSLDEKQQLVNTAIKKYLK